MAAIRVAFSAFGGIGGLMLRLRALRSKSAHDVEHLHTAGAERIPLPSEIQRCWHLD